MSSRGGHRVWRFATSSPRELFVFKARDVNLEVNRFGNRWYEDHYELE